LDRLAFLDSNGKISSKGVKRKRNVLRGAISIEKAFAIPATSVGTRKRMSRRLKRIFGKSRFLT
jgi:hypothetical protein